MDNLWTILELWTIIHSYGQLSIAWTIVHRVLWTIVHAWTIIVHAWTIVHGPLWTIVHTMDNCPLSMSMYTITVTSSSWQNLWCATSTPSTSPKFMSINLYMISYCLITFSFVLVSILLQIVENMMLNS